MDLEASLVHLAVGASPQTGGGGEVKIGKGDVTDCQSRCVGRFDPTTLGLTIIDGSVRNYQGVLHSK